MLKFALFAVLAYLLLRAVLNLARAMRRGAEQPGSSFPKGKRRPPRFRNERRQSEAQQRRETRATRLRDEEDVEDARWEDL